MASATGTARRMPIRPGSLAVLLIALALTAGGVVLTHHVIHAQENKLLKERTAEVGLVLNGGVNDLATGLHTQGGVLKATDGSVIAYRRAAAAVLATAQPTEGFAWLRAADGGRSYVVVAAAGQGFHAGQVLTDARINVMNEAMRDPRIVATPVLGASRRIGFALGPPAAPAGTVVYEQLTLGPIAPPQEAGTSPFSELDLNLYSSTTADPSQVLISTTLGRTLSGDVRRQLTTVGANRWLLVVKARRPLVGSLTAAAPWFVLGFGLVTSLLVLAVVETVARRRDAALAAYAGEHHIAETLQRNLLPRLPTLPGLQLAARYLPAGQRQQVGGDWFDAFALPGGAVGLVIGDVIGHDISAASAMSQIRAALRAYAVDGSPPASVIERLTHMVMTFDVTPLVTVFYGVLRAPAPDGSRVLEYSNAGHLPPLLREPSGQVSSLDRAGSVVIGAPTVTAHPQAEHRLAPGSCLVLFTDGLVEAPGQPLDEAVDRLAAGVARHATVAEIEQFCDEVINHTLGSEPRDDVAVLAVRVS